MPIPLNTGQCVPTFGRLAKILVGKSLRIHGIAVYKERGFSIALRSRKKPLSLRASAFHYKVV